MDVDHLAEKAIHQGIEVLLISTLMLRSALRVKDLRKRLRDLGGDVKILVGGAPFRFDDQLFKDVDADAMGTSASDAMAFLRNGLG